MFAVKNDSSFLGLWDIMAHFQAEKIALKRYLRIISWSFPKELWYCIKPLRKPMVRFFSLDIAM